MYRDRWDGKALLEFFYNCNFGLMSSKSIFCLCIGRLISHHFYKWTFENLAKQWFAKNGLGSIRSYTFTIGRSKYFSTGAWQVSWHTSFSASHSNLPWEISLSKSPHLLDFVTFVIVIIKFETSVSIWVGHIMNISTSNIIFYHATFKCTLFNKCWTEICGNLGLFNFPSNQIFFRGINF